MCWEYGVHLTGYPETISNEEDESAEGLPGMTSRSMTNSFSINTLRPRRDASALEFIGIGWSRREPELTLTSSDELDEEPGEEARVLAGEAWPPFPDLRIDSGDAVAENIGMDCIRCALGVVANIAAM